jgi:hypothetical protein
MAWNYHWKAAEPSTPDERAPSLCGDSVLLNIASKPEEITCPKCSAAYYERILDDLASGGAKIEVRRQEEITERFPDYRSSYRVLIDGKLYAFVRCLNGWGKGWHIYDPVHLEEVKVNFGWRGLGGASRQHAVFIVATKAAAGELKDAETIKAEEERLRKQTEERRAKREAEEAEERKENAARLQRGIDACEAEIERHPENEAMYDALAILSALKQKGEWP